MRKVEVVFRDSMSLGRWRDKEDALRETRDPAYLNCSIAGYLLDESNTHVTVVQGIAVGGESVCEAFTVPREAIVTVTELHPVEEEPK